MMKQIVAILEISGEILYSLIVSFDQDAMPSNRELLYTYQTYIISGRAQAILSDVVQSILEECLQDAKNFAMAAGKSCVTSEEMEKALRKLCLRLNAQPSTPGK